MDDSGGKPTSEDEARRAAFGELPLPADVEKVGDFEETPHGRMRVLEFPAAYEDPFQDEDGAWVAQEVRLVGLQSESGEIRFGVNILIKALTLAPGAAAEIGAAIKDVAENAQRNNDTPQVWK